MSARSPFLYRAITENDHWFVQLMARLRPGTSDARLKAALNVAFARATAPVVKQPDVLVEPGHGGLTQDRNRYRKPLLLMLGVVGLVMLAACANLTGLSLARGAVRAHELAVRSALGANRWRLFRQALTESIVLTLLGGGLGILLAISGRSAIARLLAGSASGLHYDFSLDFIVLSFSMVIGLITALLSGLWPALRASRVAPVDGLRSRGTMGAPRLRSGRILVASQICLSLLLLTGAGLYVRTLANLTRINAGFSVEKLLIAKLNIRSGDYANNQPAEFYKRVENAIAVLPGVQAVTVIEFPLLAHVGSSSGVDGLSGRSSDPTATTPMQTQRLTVSEAFFTTMGIPILQGRGFAANDAAEAPKVVVVNESFVRDYLPNDDPIGISFSVWSARWQIVGVCRDAKYSDIKEAVKPTTFFPITQRFYSRYRDKHLRDASIAVRTALSPLALSTAVRKVVAQIDPGVAVTQITTQKVVRDQGISQERLLAVLCCSLAGLAVLLSCIGLYSLIAYNVARCTGEIGIRMALGATRRNIAWPILREAVLLALAGVAIGVPVALALARFVKSQLYGVAPTDPTTLIGAGVLLMIVAIFTAWIPARRATKVDPMVALRHE
jgi:predicted permease